MPLQIAYFFYYSFDIQLDIKNEGTTIIKNSGIHKQRDSDTQIMYNNIMSSMVDNPKDIPFSKSNSSLLRLGTTVPQELSYEYVVVTSEELAPAFKRFVAWKNQKGINIGIVTMEYIRNNYSGDLISGINDDAGKLRQFLSESYAHNLVYALLGGDRNHVPIRLGCSRNFPSNYDTYTYIEPTDLYFSDFNGDWNVDGDSFYGEPTQDNPDRSTEFLRLTLFIRNMQEEALYPI
jgi:hypothetical protein